MTGRKERSMVVADQRHLIMDLSLLAGKILLQGGAETYRVEDSMSRIAHAYGLEETHSFVTPTGIIFAIDGSDPKTRFIRVTDRETDLHKVDQVNQFTRDCTDRPRPLEEALAVLRKIGEQRPLYPEWIKVGGAALTSGCFLIMFQGVWSDFLAAFVAGGIGYAVATISDRLIAIRFLAEFVASAVIGAVVWAMVLYGFGSDADKIIIGSVMPLVPGVLITSAVRDLIAGHLVAGISRGAEALITAFAIGTGIALSLFVQQLLGGGWS